MPLFEASRLQDDIVDFKATIRDTTLEARTMSTELLISASRICKNALLPRDTVLDFAMMVLRCGTPLNYDLCEMYCLCLTNGETTLSEIDLNLGSIQAHYRLET